MKSIPLVFFGIFILGLAVWAGILILTWKDNNPNQLLIEMGKTGVSLSLITVIGGIIQSILKDRDEKNQKADEKLKFYHNLLLDLKSVYDKVEKARLLIEAHQSAKTYGEQMQELIGGVVILHNVKRALNPQFHELEKKILPSINDMSIFLKNLLKEYRDNYKRISILQEIDEQKKKTLLLRKNADLDKKIEDSELSSEAWGQIKILDKLNILRDDDNHNLYEAGFLKHLDNASSIIRKLIPVEKDEQLNF